MFFREHFLHHGRRMDDVQWRVQRTAAPTVEPVSLDDQKAFNRVDGNDDDDLIASQIASARDIVENYLSGRVLLTQTWALYLDRWPRVIELPRAPVQAISSIKYIDANGDLQTLTSSAYQTDLVGDPCRIKTAPGQSWPSISRESFNPITVTFVAGFGDDATDVPAPLVEGVKAVAAGLYVNRGPAPISMVLPADIASAIFDYKLTYF